MDTYFVPLVSGSEEFHHNHTKHGLTSWVLDILVVLTSLKVGQRSVTRS